MSRKRGRHFTDDFKTQIVDLYQAGKKRRELIRDYELTPSTFDKWVKQSKTTGSFKTVDNLTAEQRELIALRKRNKELDMQVDILKQAQVLWRKKEHLPIEEAKFFKSPVPSSLIVQVKNKDVIILFLHVFSEIFLTIGWH